MHDDLLNSKMEETLGPEVLQSIVGGNFATLPPEINSALMFAGAGSGPMLSAASAWDGLSAEISNNAASYWNQQSIANNANGALIF